MFNVGIIKISFQIIRIPFKLLLIKSNIFSLKFVISLS